MQTQRRCELSEGLSNCVVDLGALVSFIQFLDDVTVMTSLMT